LGNRAAKKRGFGNFCTETFIWSLKSAITFAPWWLEQQGGHIFQRIQGKCVIPRSRTVGTTCDFGCVSHGRAGNW